MKMFRKDEGFTLVELMVVVLIIGILVAIAVPVFLNASADAAKNSCNSNQRIIEGAVQTYNSTGVGVTTPYPTAATLVGDTNVLIGGAIKAAPDCPTAAAGNYATTNGIVTSDNAVAATDITWAAGHSHY